MYLAMVAALMFALPVGSVVADTMLRAHGLWSGAVVLKWFVFWSVGVRLLVAGLRQIAQPRYTAETILGIQGVESLLLVRELGFANVAIGSVGVCSWFFPAWLMPAAVAGMVFFGLAGINHITARRNSHQTIALVSDLFVAAVLLGAILI
jgi:hypothetical protein